MTKMLKAASVVALIAGAAAPAFAAGDKIREFSIVTRREGWLKIRIADRYEGWIDASRAVTW